MMRCGSAVSSSSHRILNSSVLASFEGERARIVVIDKGADSLRWLLGRARGDAFDDWWQAWHLTETVLVLGIVSIVATPVLMMMSVKFDRRLFLIPGVAGCGLWLNLWTSRSPRVLRELMTSFGE